jgi:D-ribose pyranase
LKKTRLLNAPLSAAIARLGHTDGLVVCDAGLPVPDGPQRIDLALVRGQPAFLDVVRTVACEMMIERALIATELATASPQLQRALEELLTELSRAQRRPIALECCPHEEFKACTRQARAIVRSGECTPYANVILYSGVAFESAG